MDQPGQIKVQGHIDVATGDLAAFEAALGDHIRLSRAEPGCLLFEIEPVADRQGRFSVREAFIDRGAFDAHTARARASHWWTITKHIPRCLDVQQT